MLLLLLLLLLLIIMLLLLLLVTPHNIADCNSRRLELHGTPSPEVKHFSVKSSEVQVTWVDLANMPDFSSYS
jgi:hypothetical protein